MTGRYNKFNKNCIHFLKGSCFKGKSCPYNHVKNQHLDDRNVEFKYKMPNYPDKVSDSQSPEGKNYIPIDYGRRSPRRYNRSPRRYSRSPRRYSRSPKRYSRSPRRYSRSPRRYSRSPRRHSPGRYSQRLRRFYDAKRQKYSQGVYRNPVEQTPLAKPAWMEGNSPKPPPDNIISPVSSKGSHSHNSEQRQQVELTFMYNNLETSDKDQLDQNSIESDIVGKVSDSNFPLDTGISVHSSNSVSIDSISKLEMEEKKDIFGEYQGDATVDPKMYSDLSPTLATFDILKTIPKEYLHFPIQINNENIQLEGGDTKSISSDKSKEADSFSKPLVKPETMLPPVTRHEYDTVRTDLALPHQFPVNNDPPCRRDQLWTPAMDRNKIKSFNLPLASNWEVDTPYISRNNPRPHPVNIPKAVLQVVEQKKSTQLSKRKSSDSRKQKKRRRKFSSSSSSDSDDSEPKRPTSKETLLDKKKTILTKVWALMEQKKKLDEQRGNIMMSHKTDTIHLPNILQENTFLSEEIDKQIFVMNRIIQEINDDLGVSVMDNHQQEFYIRSNLLRDDTDAIGNKKSSAPKFPVISDSEKNYTNKFLKPSDAHRHDNNKKDKYSAKKGKERIKEEVPPKKYEKKYTKDRYKEEKSKGPVFKSSKQIFKDTDKGKDKNEGQAKELKNTVKSDEEYAPSANLKPHVKYIDQGMHWCMLCTEFMDSVTNYFEHLQSYDHLKMLKKDEKIWLPKHIPIQKEKVQKDAPVLTIPLQGVEFMHSMTGFYCSLCDLLIKTEPEAKEHTETKIHVSKHKDFLSKNSMYETTYIKDKMAAFAKYSVEKERKKTFFPKRGDTIPPLPKKSSKSEKQEAQPITIPADKNTFPICLAPIKEIKPFISDTSSMSVGCISPVQIAVNPISISKSDETIKELENVESLEEESKSLSIRVACRTSQPVEDKNNKENKFYIIDECNDICTPLPEMKTEIDEPIQQKEYKSKMNTLRKKVALTDSDHSKNLGINKFSNIMIGKMPFLKRNRRPLVITEEKPNLLKETNITNEEVTSESILPQTKPKNVDYITEIESFGSETKFTKVIGPTMQGSDSDMEIDPVITPLVQNDDISNKPAISAELMESNYQSPMYNYSVAPPCLPYQQISQPAPFMGSAMSPYNPAPYMNYPPVPYNQINNYSNQYNCMTNYANDYPFPAPRTVFQESQLSEKRFDTPPPPGTELSEKRLDTPPPPGTESQTVHSNNTNHLSNESIKTEKSVNPESYSAEQEINVSPSIIESESVIINSDHPATDVHNVIDESIATNLDKGSHSGSPRLTLQEAIDLGLNESQDSCPNKAFKALSEELSKLEDVSDSQKVIDVLAASLSAEMPPKDPSDEEGIDHEQLILEGLQLLDGADSSDGSNEN